MIGLVFALCVSLASASCWVPLAKAIEEGRPDVVRQIIESDPSLIEAPIPVLPTDETMPAETMTPLLLAISKSRLNVFKVLLDAQANVDATSFIPDGSRPDKVRPYRSALHLAATSRSCFSLDFVRLLVERGANGNVLDDSGLTPFLVALREKLVEPQVIPYLLQGYTLPIPGDALLTICDPSTGYTDQAAIVLCQAILNCEDHQHTEMLLSASDMTTGMTALHHACTRGCVGLIELLLKAGSRFDGANAQGKVPLDLVCPDSPYLSEICQLFKDLPLIPRGHISILSQKFDMESTLSLLPMELLRHILDMSRQVHQYVDEREQQERQKAQNRALTAQLLFDLIGDYDVVGLVFDRMDIELED